MRRFTSGIAVKLMTLVLCVGLFAAPIDHTLTVQKAEAQGVVAGLIGSFAQNALGGTIGSFLNAALQQKELVWDGMFYNLGKKILQEMTQNIIQWVNSGFDGDPAFVTDLNEYKLETKDEVAGNYIYGDDLDPICDAFELDVRAALAEKHVTERTPSSKTKAIAQCTAESKGNVGKFIEGDFTEGGWDMWFEIVLNPERNTPLGTFLSLEEDLNDNIEEEISNKMAEYQANQGFISMKSCSGEDSVAGIGEKCTVTTPGIIIKDQLSFALETPARSLIEADEVDEILGALFSRLAEQAITGVNGLLGLGGNTQFSDFSFGESGGLSYLDAMQQDPSTAAVSKKGLESALQTEYAILELNLELIGMVDDVEEIYDDAKASFEGDSCFNLSFPSILTQERAISLNEVKDSLDIITTLESMIEEYDQSQSTQRQNAVLSAFTQMQSAGELSEPSDISTLEVLIGEEIEPRIEKFGENLDDEVNSCS